MEHWHAPSQSRWEYWLPKAFIWVLLWGLLSGEGSCLAQDAAPSLVAAHIQRLFISGAQRSSPLVSIWSNPKIIPVLRMQTLQQLQASSASTSTQSYLLPPSQVLLLRTGPRKAAAHKSASVPSKSGPIQNQCRCQIPQWTKRNSLGTYILGLGWGWREKEKQKYHMSGSDKSCEDKWTSKIRKWRGTVPNGLIRVGLLVRDTAAKAWRKWVKHDNTREKTISGRGKSRCKGPEGEACLVCLQDSEKAWMAGKNKRREK